MFNFLKIDNNKKKYLAFNLSLIFICLLVIFFSAPHFSYQSYYWFDFILAQFNHNQNLTNRFLDILPNSGNIFGITLWVLEPSLNFLSKFNYNLSNRSEYFLYLALLRSFEIFTLITFLYSFSKKIEIKDLSIIFFLYVILLFNFNRYDHESYINFPILIFCIFHALSARVKNNYFFFILVLIANLWSYLINPIYFFITCFSPLIFFYSYLFYKKEFKKLLITFFTNLPFAIYFILLALGTSRYSLSEFYVGSIPRQNFALYNSKNFFLIASVLFLLSINILRKKNNFFCWFFVFYIFFCIVVGAIFKFEPNNWKMPQPYQFEYAFQFILIFIFYKIIEASDKNFIFKICLIILVILFAYRSIFFIKKYINLNDLSKSEKTYIDKNENLQKRYFWSKAEGKFFLEKDLKNKRIFLNLPNYGSNFHKSYSSVDFGFDDNQQTFELGSFYFNKNFNGSLWWPIFWDNKIAINQGYSFNLDINTVLAHYFNPTTKEIFDKKYNRKYLLNLADGRIYNRSEVPKFNLKKLVDFYQVDYVLSDVILDRTFYKNYSLYKSYEFQSFSLYFYKKKNIIKNSQINKVNFIESYKNYEENIKNFNNQLFIEKKDFNKVSDLKKFCDVEAHNEDNSIFFEVKKNNSKKCLAIFPIPFSHNNLFTSQTQKVKEKSTCKTLRVQFFFHACVIEEDQKFTLKKKNLLLYPLGAFRDFVDYKLIK